MNEHILLVGGEASSRQNLGMALKEQGYSVGLYTHGMTHETEPTAEHPDLILIDHPWPKDVNKSVIKLWAAVHSVLMLLSEDVASEDTLQALRLGIAEVLVKPVDTAELIGAIRRIIDNAMLYRTGDFYTHLLRQEEPSLLIGNSLPLRRLLDNLQAVAPTDATVLILGESGVGKEKVAQEIHRLSLRVAHPFVAVDCCSLQEALFESELFGHERGAFTGAVQRKTGLIEHASGGTVFLDEIGEIPPAIQAKLLRVLETKRFRRLGGTEDLIAEVRILAATNRDLADMASRGEFRQDLLYRLNAFVVEVPPLRERRDDILPIARYFLSHPSVTRRIGKRMSEVAEHSLVSYDWPGNVRELRNVIERAVILSGNKMKIDQEHLTLPKPGTTANHSTSVVTLTFDHEPTLAEIEQRYLALLLERHQGRRAAVAKVLGVGERTLYRMIGQLKSERGGKG